MIRNAVGAIVTYGDLCLLVHKVKINTQSGKEYINAEWDFVKGGVKESEVDLQQAILRELTEETGVSHYKLIKQFHEKINFTFPTDIQKKIGYVKQETTMFHFEYLGAPEQLNPIDDEIKEVVFVKLKDVYNKLSHMDTKEFFKVNFSEYC